MTNARIFELYCNMLNHISELVSGSDLVDTLHAIGFTDEEIKTEGFGVDEDDEDDDFLSDLADEAAIDEMCRSWIGELLERLDKDSIEDLTIKDLRDEIEEMHGTIENESILIGVSGYAKENIKQFKAYIEYLEALIEEKEVIA